MKIIRLFLLFLVSTNLSNTWAKSENLVGSSDTGFNTVLAIYQYARKHAPLLKLKQMDLAEQVEIYKQVRSTKYPKVMLTGNISRYDYRSSVDGNQVSRDGYLENNLGIRLHHKIFEYGLQETIGAQAKQIQSTEYANKLFENDYRIQVVEWILENLITLEQLSHLKAAKKAIAKHVKIQKRRYQLGSASKTDLLQVEAELAQIESKLIQAQNNNQIARLQFQENTNINSNIDFSWRLGNIDINPIIQNLNYDILYAKAMEQNQQIHAANLKLESSKLSYEASKSNQYPVINLSTGLSQKFATGHYSAIPNPILNNNNHNLIFDLGIYLEYPLYSGGFKAAEVNKSAAKMGKAQADLDLQKLQLRIAVKSAWSQLENAISRQDVALAFQDTAQQARDAVSRSGELGLKNIYEVLEAEQKLLQAKLQVNIAKSKLIQAYLSIQNTVGELSDLDLQLVDQWIEIKQY